MPSAPLNGQLQPRPEAGAQRTLEGVGCKLMLDSRYSLSPPLASRYLSPLSLPAEAGENGCRCGMVAASAPNERSRAEEHPAHTDNDNRLSTRVGSDICL